MLEKRGKSSWCRLRVRGVGNLLRRLWLRRVGVVDLDLDPTSSLESRKLVNVRARSQPEADLFVFGG